MAIFNKIFGLAGAVVVFTGLAFGQATCNNPQATPTFIRAEGTTELVSNLTFSCTGGNGSNMNVSLFLSPSVTITSKVLQSSSGKTEAVALTSAPAAPQVAGTVSGNSIVFSDIPTPVGAFTVTVSNVRINASMIAVGTGVPPAISETAFLGGAGVVPTSLTSTNVAYVQAGLGSVKAFTDAAATKAGVNNFVVCNGAAAQAGNPAAPTPAFYLQLSEGFPGAFKTQVGESGLATTLASNTATSGTRVKLPFANVPANVSVYVPTTITAGDGSVLTLTSSETGAYSAVNPASGNSISSLGNVAQVSISGGAGTAVYEVTNAVSGSLDVYTFPVYLIASANSVAASSSPITVAASLAPVGSTSNIPSFVTGTSTTTVNLSVFSQCTTSLLFPFVTNQLGFDTGIAIANTSTDPFGSKGAVAQAGTCTLNFYGNGAPSPANVTTANIASGTVFTQVLSGVAAGFQGYMIAQCNFQFAHGFAFITDGVGANGGLSQGYLAGVLPDTNQTSRKANPAAQAAAGSGETLEN